MLMPRNPFEGVASRLFWDEPKSTTLGMISEAEKHLLPRNLILRRPRAARL